MIKVVLFRLDGVLIKEQKVQPFLHHTFQQLKDNGVKIGILSCTDENTTINEICSETVDYISCKETYIETLEDSINHFDVFRNEVLYVGCDETDNEIAYETAVQYVAFKKEDDMQTKVRISSLEEVLQYVIEKPGMKWYFFTIYFSLFFMAITNMLNGMELITGRALNQNGITSEMVYNVFPMLKWVNIIYGVVLIAFGLFAIHVRIDLANYKRSGIRDYKFLLGLMVVLPFLYLIAMIYLGAQNNINVLTDEAKMLYTGQALAQILMLIVAHVYYKKRLYMFH